MKYPSQHHAYPVTSTSALRMRTIARYASGARIAVTAYIAAFSAFTLTLLDDDSSVADAFVWIALGAIVDAIARGVVDGVLSRYREGGEHPLDEPLRATAFQAQESLPKIVASLDVIAAVMQHNLEQSTSEDNKPPTRRR